MAYPLFLRKLLIRSGVARHLPGVQRLTDGAGAFLNYYSDQTLTAPYAELRDAAAFMEPRGPDAIDLALGAPCFDLVPSASTKLPADRRGWPSLWGMPELREVVADQLHADQSSTVNPSDEVLITHGGTGAFHVALDTFVNAGDRVALFDPTSPLHVFGLRHRRARLRWITTWMENGRTRFRLDQLAQAMKRAKFLVLSSPNNPTGGVIAAEDLEQIAWWAERREVLILSDEVFSHYHYEQNAGNIGSLPKARRRTLTLGSVSKTYALASTRVGWLAGHRHLIRPCALNAALHTPFVPTISQQIALTALRLGEEVVRPVRAEFDSRRRYAFERLQALGLKPAWPAGAFFFWMPLQQLGMDGRIFSQRLLKEKRVLVTPGSFFGPSGSQFIRLSYATEDGRLRQGLSRLAEFLREHCSPSARQAA